MGNLRDIPPNEVGIYESYGIRVESVEVKEND